MLCTDVVDCVNKTAPVVDGPTEYKMIRTTNVKAGRINLDDCRYVDEATFVKWTRRIQPKRHDIVLTREAPLGEVGLLRSDESVFLGQRTMLYRANPEKLDQRFLYYSMLGPFVQAQIRSQGSGATVEHLRVPDAESFLVAYPPLDEQRRIAALLSAYDDLIANNRRRIALLDSTAEEIYREWFVRMRFPGAANGVSRVNPPPGWSYVDLPKLASITYGFTFAGDRFSELDIGKKIIRIRDVLAGDSKTYTEEIADDKYVVCAGDLLIGMDGEFHMNHWVAEDAYLVQRTCRVVPKQERLRAYLAHSLKAPISHYQQTIVGATVGHLGAKHLNAIKLLVPPDSLNPQLQLLNQLLEQRLVLSKQNLRLAKSRDALLPRLISGKLRVEALDIQFPPSMQQQPPAEAAPREAIAL